MIFGDVQVALGRDRGADQEGLVGRAHVRRLAVDLRVDGDRDDPHLLQGAGDADGDLAAVGYEHLLEHGGAVYLGGEASGLLGAQGVVNSTDTQPNSSLSGRRVEAGEDVDAVGREGAAHEAVGEGLAAVETVGRRRCRG